MAGLTFPKNPSEGQTASWTFTDDNNVVIKRLWTFDAGTSSWSATPANLASGAGSELGSVSGNSKESGVARWEYTVYSADFNGSSWVVSSPSVTATNLLEVQNTGTTAYGISVTGDQGITLSGFTGFAVMPVPNGTLVELIYKGGNYFFSAPNPIDGIC